MRTSLLLLCLMLCSSVVFSQKKDSLYSWRWSGEGLIDEEMLKRFEEDFGELHEHMQKFGEEFMSEFQLDDSVFLHDRFEKFFDEDAFQLHGFNFNWENFDDMPIDKEKMEELRKHMRELLDGEYDERIKKFIEEHKHDLDEIRYQIRESIPNRRKAI